MKILFFSFSSYEQVSDLRKQLSNLQNELQEAIQSRKTAISNEQAAREGFENQVKLAAEVLFYVSLIEA